MKPKHSNVPISAKMPRTRPANTAVTNKRRQAATTGLKAKAANASRRRLVRIHVLKGTTYRFSILRAFVRILCETGHHNLGHRLG